MFKKKIYLFLIIVIGLIAISAVSAADDNATDIISMDENEEIILEENSNENVLNIENNDNIVSTNTTGTFTELNEAINGNDKDTVELTQDYAYDSTSDSSLKNGKVLKSNNKLGSTALTAEELKNTTIDANITVNEEDMTITVELDENATGFVQYNLTGEESHIWYMNVENGQSIIEYVLTPGNYTVEITYLGDDKYNKNTTTKTFTVIGHIKNDTEITSTATVENYTVTITTDVDSNATGYVTLAILGQTFIVPVDNGNAVFTYDFNPGNYTAYITYLGDDNFNANTTESTFTVEEIPLKNTTIDANITINGEDFTITVNVNPNATGFVQYNLIGEENYILYMDIVDGQSIIEDALTPGNYTIEITYLGDANYNTNATTLNFTIEEIPLKNTTIDANIAINEEDITITVNIDKNATGYVQFNVTGAENYVVYMDVVDGQSIFEDDLTPGNYTIEITYLGDDRYNTNATTKTFTIVGHVKNDTEISSTAEVENSTVTITTNVDSNATGFITLEILGQTFLVPVDNGRAVFTYDFNIGTYSANIAYLGDYNFNNATTTTTFTVTNQSAELENTTVNVDVEAVENNVTITATVNSSASGLVEFNIGGKAVYITVNNGAAAYNVVLPAGDYNVEVTYMGDSRYNANRTSRAFTVTDHIKKNTTLTLDIRFDEYNVTVIAEVDSNATGFVEFKLNGNAIISKVDEGKAIMDTLLFPGEYTVYATYLGDHDFNANTSESTFTVEEIPLKNTTINANITINEEDITITVNVNPNATGFVQYNITGEENHILFMNVTDGQSIIEYVLTPGDYTVEITYLGDANYNKNATTETFTIVGHIKKDTAISSTATVKNGTVTITTNVDSNATGYVTLEILGQTFIVPVDNGSAVFTYDFNLGTYSTNVAYLGDYNFNSATTTTAFTVTNQSSELKNTTVNVEVETFGTDVIITATVDSLASGLVEFNIDGKAVYLAVNNGKAAYNVILPTGNYNVTVTYLGDSRFNSNSTSKEFTVIGPTKKNTTMSAEVSVKDLNVVVTVTLDNDAAGFVEFIMNEEIVYLPVQDGKVVLNTTFKPGEYIIIANYLGDDDFNQNSTLVELTVNKVETQVITAKVSTVYGTSGTLSLTLTDVNGNLLIGKNVTINFNNKVYTRTVNSYGKASLTIGKTLVPKTYTATITFAGDDIYLTSNNTAKVVVSKATPKITAKAQTYKVSVKTKKYSVTLKGNDNKALANVKLSIKVNGKTYSAKTNSKGTATFKITGLTKKAKYIGLITYAGNKYYKNLSKKVQITVK